MKVMFWIAWSVGVALCAVTVALFIYSTAQCLVVAHRLPVWPWEKFGCAEAAR